MTARISDEVRERVAAHFAGTIEHIEPRSAQGSDDESNLCLSCYRCNLRKATRIAAVDPRTRKKTPLFHPRQQTWQDHFRWSADPVRIVALSPVGRATIAVLRMNDDEFIRARRLWITGGWHPPQSS